MHCRFYVDLYVGFIKQILYSEIGLAGDWRRRGHGKDSSHCGGNSKTGNMLLSQYNRICSFAHKLHSWSWIICICYSKKVNFLLKDHSCCNRSLAVWWWPIWRPWPLSRVLVHLDKRDCVVFVLFFLCFCSCCVQAYVLKLSCSCVSIVLLNKQVWHSVTYRLERLTCNVESTVLSLVRDSYWVTV